MKMELKETFEKSLSVHDHCNFHGGVEMGLCFRVIARSGKLHKFQTRVVSMLDELDLIKQHTAFPPVKLV